MNRTIIVTLTNNKKLAFETSNSFLSSVLRNSRKSKVAYESALNHFQRFLQDKYPLFNIQSILAPLSEGKIDVYNMLEEFISHILNVRPNLTPNSMKLYMAAVRSYLAFNDIDVIPSKFKRKVRMPKLYREDEEPLDVSDIRKILLSCNNRRLKGYLLILSSGGVRAVEGLAIRLKDIDFSASPTKIHIRKEYTKTRVSRDIYISAEADLYLKQWLDWKYNNKERPRKSNPDDLVFAAHHSTNPNWLYEKMLIEFQKLLTIVRLDERIEGIKRRKITLHSFRRFVKTTILIIFI